DLVVFNHKNILATRSLQRFQNNMLVEMAIESFDIVYVSSDNCLRPNALRAILEIHFIYCTCWGTGCVKNDDTMSWRDPTEDDSGILCARAVFEIDCRVIS